MRKVGRILWWSSRDENGVLVDPHGNEYYFDRSIITQEQKKKIRKDTYVRFQADRLDGLLVATKIVLPKANSTKLYSQEFENETVQLLLALAV